MFDVLIFIAASFFMGYFIGKAKNPKHPQYLVSYQDMQLELPQMLDKAGIYSTEDQLKLLNQVMCKEKIGFIK